MLLHCPTGTTPEEPSVYHLSVVADDLSHLLRALLCLLLAWHCVTQPASCLTAARPAASAFSAQACSSGSRSARASCLSLFSLSYGFALCIAACLILTRLARLPSSWLPLQACSRAGGVPARPASQLPLSISYGFVLCSQPVACPAQQVGSGAGGVPARAASQLPLFPLGFALYSQRAACLPNRSAAVQEGCLRDLLLTFPLSLLWLCPVLTTCCMPCPAGPQGCSRGACATCLSLSFLSLLWLCAVFTACCIFAQQVRSGAVGVPARAATGRPTLDQAPTRGAAAGRAGGMVGGSVLLPPCWRCLAPC